MSPLDDELRRTMHERADVLMPAADPLSGIEQRARGISRRRRTAAVLSTALIIVAGVAIAVPQLANSPAKTDVVQLSSPSATPSDGDPTLPTNYLNWPGSDQQELLGPTINWSGRYAEALGRIDEIDRASYTPYYVGQVGGITYTIGQGYIQGDPAARTFGWVTGPEPQSSSSFLGPETPAGTQVLALLVDSIPGRTTDLLVLVPRPGTGQLSYSPDATTPFRPVPSSGHDLVGLVDRSRTASNDRIQVLDGNGDINKPLYEGPVQPFLCAAKECG